MTQSENKNIFPRQLTTTEKKLLHMLLPESKTGYKFFEQKLKDKFVVGYGRFGGSNFVLGDQSGKPDLEIPSTPIFAFGQFKYGETEFNVVIHEEDEGLIEIDLGDYNQIPGEPDFNKLNYWTYSDWVPGNVSPGDNETVREISFGNGGYIFVVAPTHKRIWVHEKSSGINYIIPITNFYNELMLVKGIKNPKIALNSSRFFEHNLEFSDEDIIRGFLSYNRYLKRIDINNDLLKQAEQIKHRSIFDLFYGRRKG